MGSCYAPFECDRAHWQAFHKDPKILRTTLFISKDALYILADKIHYISWLIIVTVLTVFSLTEPRLQEDVRCEVRAFEHSVGAEAADTSSLCLVCDVRVRPNPVHPLHAVPNFVDPLQLPGNTVPRVDLV
jgi:hypothetical protein